MSVKEYISAVTNDRAELRKKLLTAQYYMGHPIKHIEFNSDLIIIDECLINLKNVFFKITDGHLREHWCLDWESDHVYIHCGNEFEVICEQQLAYDELPVFADSLLPPEIFVFKIELYKGE
jgi:hypothetical protein